jgi:hypothetical protein
MFRDVRWVGFLPPLINKAERAEDKHYNLLCSNIGAKVKKCY